MQSKRRRKRKTKKLRETTSHLKRLTCWFLNLATAPPPPTNSFLHAHRSRGSIPQRCCWLQTTCLPVSSGCHASLLPTDSHLSHRVNTSLCWGNQLSGYCDTNMLSKVSKWCVWCFVHALMAQPKEGKTCSIMSTEAEDTKMPPIALWAESVSITSNYDKNAQHFWHRPQASTNQRDFLFGLTFHKN